MISVEPIFENCDKIVYYDVNGRIIEEFRVLNNLHPHVYSAIRNLADKTIRYNNQDYCIVESSVDYLQKPFGTIHITHLKIKPLK